MENFRPIIMIPFYNNYEVFKELFPRIQTFPLIVVNDGSSPAETEKLHQLLKRHKVVDLKKNSGKGAAAQVAIREAEAMGYSHLLQIDAEYNTADISRFLTASCDNPDAIINGVSLYGESAPNVCKFTNFWVRREIGSDEIADAMCGFRIYPIKLISPIFSKIKFLRMGFDVEVIVRAFWSGIKIINLETKVSCKKGAVSHFHVFSDNLKNILLHSYLCAVAPHYKRRKKD